MIPGNTPVHHAQRIGSQYGVTHYLSNQPQKP